MSRQSDISSKCILKHETAENDPSLVSGEPIDRRGEDDNHWNQLNKAIAIKSEDDLNNAEENNEKKKKKESKNNHIRRMTLDFKEAYNIVQKMIVEKDKEDGDLIKGEIKGKSFEGQLVKYIIVDRGRKTNPMLMIQLAACNKIVKFLLVGKENCPLCRPDKKMKGNQSLVSKVANHGKYKDFCDLMESISFTDCIYNKIKNDTHIHEATTNTNFKYLTKLVDQIIIKKEKNKRDKPIFLKGEISENINWKFLQGASKITVVVREKGKHGPTFEINIKKEISFIIKSRIKDPPNVKIHSVINEVDNSISNQPELVTTSIDPEEAPDNLVTTGGMQGIASMTKKSNTGMPSKSEVVAVSSDPKEAPVNVVMTGEEMQAIDSMTEENDNGIPNQPELVTANSDSEEAPDNLVMTGGMQGIDSMTKKDDTATGMSSKLEEVMVISDLKETPDNVIIGEMQAIISAVTKENNNGIPNQLELVTASSDSKETPDNLVMT